METRAKEKIVKATRREDKKTNYLQGAMIQMTIDLPTQTMEGSRQENSILNDGQPRIQQLVGKILQK